MEQSELLRFLVRVFENLGLRYFVTGSVASIFYGEPRFTNDIDVVVELPVSRTQAFCQSFDPKEYYLSEESVQEAVRSGGQFNILHPSSGLKIDIIIAPSTPFEQGRFARRRLLEPEKDLRVYFASPEDVIIKKLVYYRESESDKHLRDVAGMIRTTGDQLDYGYIAGWVERMGLKEIWDAVLKRVSEAR